MPVGQRYHIETWGCQMNAHETERVSGLLEAQGLRRADGARDADLILLNTCAVREGATGKVLTRLGELRSLKENDPHKVIGVLGCVAQERGAELFRRAPHVDLVVGPRALASVPRLLEQVRTTRHLMDLEHYTESVLYGHEQIRRQDSRKAYLTVIEGCSKACSYCIVPFTRGREVSRPFANILSEVRYLVERGTLEVELLGQNVNAWRDGGRDFADLLREIGAVAGLRRIRFVTSHPLHFSQRIIEAMRDCKQVCNYLHLPPQSGSDRVLRRMKRGYTRRHYLACIGALRQAVPDVRLSGDIIVGFPGETDEDFEATLDLLEGARFDSLFSFRYSPRPHTTATEFTDQVPRAVQDGRLARLQERQRQIQEVANRRHLGQIYEVRVEGPSPKGHTLCGRTAHGLMVHFEAPRESPDSFVNVQVTRTGIHSVSGERVELSPGTSPITAL
ncbi:MAG: tRNA (N6-isopentenyl adenosine(37)-C2)-methylthiotransferase MiaB [Acidobacteriota bacterium]